MKEEQKKKYENMLVTLLDMLSAFTEYTETLNKLYKTDVIHSASSILEKVNPERAIRDIIIEIKKTVLRQNDYEMSIECEELFGKLIDSVTFDTDSQNMAEVFMRFATDTDIV